MASSNFIVQNGLTVGPMTIFAGNGDVTTTGNISVTGSGSFGGLNPQQIYNGTTNVTASASYVNVAIGGSNIASFSSTGLSVIGTTTTINQEIVLQTEIVQGNLVAAATTASTNTTTGSFIAKGGAGIAGDVFVGGNVVPSSNANPTSTNNIGSSTAWWNSIYGTSTHALYADLAENYLADREYTPGTVLMFGGISEVTVAEADTTRVAGVVSTNPAHLMNGALKGAHVVPLALTGRVPCMVIGPVQKGDLMVSAGWGYAKVNNNPPVGTVIGKALEDFSSPSKGVIEVVVGRF